MNRRFQSSFPKIHPHAPDTIQTPSWNQLSRTGKFKKVLWTFGKALVQRKSKYAIKAGLATALLASPAFFDATRPLFIEYWGDWALISVSYFHRLRQIAAIILLSVFCCSLTNNWCCKSP